MLVSVRAAVFLTAGGAYVAYMIGTKLEKSVQLRWRTQLCAVASDM